MASSSTFVEVLAWLAGSQEAVLDGSVGGVPERVYDAAKRHPAVDEGRITAMGKAGHSAAIDGKRPRHCIWLAPTTDQEAALPLLSPHWDLRPDQFPQIHLYLAVYYWDEKAGGVDGFGFRFEAPHGSGPTKLGQHDYYHAQPIMDFADGAGIELLVQARSQPDEPSDVSS